MVKPLQKIARQLLIKLNMYMTTTIPILKTICTGIAILFTIAENWKQPKYSLISKWICAL
jgi:hypothetical protein